MNNVFEQVDDYEVEDYDVYENIESVSHDRAWGFCDPKCFDSKEDLLAQDLQEVHSHFQMG